MAAERKVARVGLNEQVLEILRGRIVDREFAPQARLNIDALARELGVSATPVREALGRLAAEGLVRAEPYVGFSVSPVPDEAWFRQLFDLRNVLEPWAAAETARRREPATLARLDALVEAMDGASLSKRYDRFRAFTRADAAFHEAIVAGTGNAPALAAWNDLRIHMQLSRLFIDRDQRTDETRLQHRAIRDAIRAGDAAAAARAMRTHLDSSKARLLPEPAPAPRPRRPSARSPRGDSPT